MQRKALIGIALTLLFAGSLPSSVSAAMCACCAERGHYDITRARPDKFYLDLLGDMNLGRSANVYLTAAGFDGVKGLEDISAEMVVENPPELNIVDKFLRRTWSLDVSTKSGRRATLTLPLPAQMVRYKVDTHDRRDAGTDVVLYKEFFFTGSVAGGTGFLRSANAKTTTYTLVFQGRGNACDNASDFTNWRLELKGPKSRFAIFGNMDVKGA